MISLTCFYWIKLSVKININQSLQQIYFRWILSIEPGLYSVEDSFTPGLVPIQSNPRFQVEQLWQYNNKFPCFTEWPRDHRWLLFMFWSVMLLRSCCCLFFFLCCSVDKWFSSISIALSGLFLSEQKHLPLLQMLLSLCSDPSCLNLWSELKLQTLALFTSTISYSDAETQHQL